MSRGDINAFLKALFASEGGTNPKVINKFGYIGKYQFGEDALCDLGYYKADGTKNRNIAGKFEYDWVGEWTGKHGIHGKDDFLNSEQVQDQAAKEWIALLCKRMKRFRLQSYIGKTINGAKITESGIIAAAHLKGFGSNKYPGVIQFLRSNGAIDPADANETHVSVYAGKFANYDLGCCGSMAAVLIDADKNPITGVGYKIKVGNKHVLEGTTDSKGATGKIEGLDAGANITILLQKLEGGYKEIKSFVMREQSTLVATLRSATRMVTTQLEKHHGPAGDYQRQSETASAGKSALAKKGDAGNRHAASSARLKSVPIEHKRNANGHPIAVAASTSSNDEIAPDPQKLEEILMRNVECGKKGQVLSGPLAAEKSRRGEPISEQTKFKADSIGQCYKYVKIALLASGMVKHYLGKEAAKDAGPELEKEGYRNLLDEPNHELKSPYDAPTGAVIVYDVTDGTKWGHIEVRVSQGFASDYFSNRPRTTAAGKENEASFIGRNRKVTGIWVKGN